ncbi:MAG: hypothetical protein AAF488_00225 [Planctomycetota bacterium]
MSGTKKLNGSAGRVSRYNKWAMQRSDQAHRAESYGLGAYRRFLQLTRAEQLKKQLRDPDFAEAIADVFRALR